MSGNWQAAKPPRGQFYGKLLSQGQELHVDMYLNIFESRASNEVKQICDVLCDCEENMLVTKAVNYINRYIQRIFSRPQIKLSLNWCGIAPGFGALKVSCLSETSWCVTHECRA